MRSHSPPITSTGAVTAAKSTTEAFESLATPRAVSQTKRPDSQTKPSYISRATSSVWVLAIQRRNCSNVGVRHGLVQGRGRNKCGRDMRKFVGVVPKMLAAGAGHAATKPAWDVRAATS